MDSHKQRVECDSELVESPKVKRNTCNGNSKPKVNPKTDYLHVRARHGKATDSHSIAERVSYQINLHCNSITCSKEVNK